ncbi:MAG: DUF3798 domain-containing protein [Fusobacteriaceae bacterium]
MKKFFVIFFMFLISVFTFSESDYHIGIVTGSFAQSYEGIQSAEELIKKYGSAKTGGEIVHVTFPDNFMKEMKTTVSTITELGQDPKIKAIIVLEAVPGTYLAFKKIKEQRKDIILIAATPHEDPEMIADVSDLVIFPDSISRGYLLVKVANELGAKKFVHLSFLRHLSSELIFRRMSIMKQASRDLGMEFIDLRVPDPLEEIGIAGAEKYIADQVPLWIEKYGKDTAFYATNDAETTPLIKGVLKNGGYFIEADLPSPTMGYPEALGLQVTRKDREDWKSLLSEIEGEVIKNGGANRMGTWVYPYKFSSAFALTEHVKNVIDKKEKITDFNALIAEYKKNTPGASWNGSKLKDSKGKTMENFILVYQDTYIFGKGYLNTTSEVIPKKYYQFKQPK